jgi:hypothetical protein
MYYSPVRRSPPGCPRAAARLACVKHSASVQSEPGSNSSVQSVFKTHSNENQRLKFLYLTVFRASVCFSLLLLTSSSRLPLSSTSTEQSSDSTHSNAFDSSASPLTTTPARKHLHLSAVWFLKIVRKQKLAGGRHRRILAHASLHLDSPAFIRARRRVCP